MTTCNKASLTFKIHSNIKYYMTFYPFVSNRRGASCPCGWKATITFFFPFCKATNFPPGIRAGQNSYRSELAGLYGVIAVISTVCSLYRLTSRNITIACDNVSALTTSLEEYTLPKISDAEYDLIYAIKNRISSLPISYQTHHVKRTSRWCPPKDGSWPMEFAQYWNG